MRIGIDGRFLLEKNLTGVGEYATKMLESWAKFFVNEEVLVFLNSFKRIDEEKLAFLKKFSNVRICYWRFPNKLLNLLFYFLAWPKLDKLLGGVDLLFLPNINFAPVSFGCRTILAVHDLSFERHPETFSFKRRLWHFLVNPRRLAMRADELWAVSLSTAEDLQCLYGIKKTKIKIIYSPFDFYFFASWKKDKDWEIRKEKLRKKYSLPDKFILSLSTLEPRKNLVSLIEAFELFLDTARTVEERKICLVLAGGKGWLWKDIDQVIKKSRWQKQIFLIGFVEKEEKSALYRLAEVFVYPSIFEGFGYPPVEAMASGAPVIVSNNSSLGEVVNSAGILIDPFRPFEIYLALREFLADKELKKIYSQKGVARAQKLFEESRKQLKEAFFSIEKQLKNDIRNNLIH